MNKKIPWNKGKKLKPLSKEHRRKQSEELKRLWRIGHFDKVRERLSKGFMLGRKHTPESKKKMRLAKLGRKLKPFSKEHRQNISKGLKGIKRSFDGVSIKKKQSARGMLNTYLARGKVKKLPCEVCGDKRSEAHHDNYDLPFAVRWFCKKHHWQVEIKKKNAV